MPAPPSPRVGVSLYFAIGGLLSASWIARIPAMTSRLDLSTGTLGLILLAFSAGALMSFPLAGGLAGSHGSAWTTRIFGLGYTITFPLLGFAWHPAILIVALWLYGFTFGGMDVAMNAQGVEVERKVGTNILGSLHGYFSLGAMAGAAISGVVAELDVSLQVHFTVAATIGLLLLIWSGRGLIADDVAATSNTQTTRDPRFVLPPRALWPLGIIAFCAAVSEGGMADWSALHVHDSLGASEGTAAFGFTIFSLTMLTGRFLGDRVVAAFGNVRVIQWCSGLAAVGYLIGMLIDTVLSVIVGYGLMGLGLSVVIPLVYRSAANAKGIPRGRAVASVATIGYSGFLAAPPVLGLVAEISSLQLTMIIIGILCGVIVFFAGATAADDGEADAVADSVAYDIT
jgi:MFS family permease